MTEVSGGQRVTPVPTASFALSLTSGILILLGGAIAMMWFTGSPPFLGGMAGMMGVHYGMMSGLGFAFGAMMIGFSVLGLVSGVAVLVGAALLQSKPEQRKTWGAIILAFSIVSFFGMGGFFVGAVLGVVGGALALA